MSRNLAYKLTHKQTTVSGLLAFLIMCLSFSKIDLVNRVDLDVSYYWALNTFFYESPEIFDRLIFIFGPLGFLKAPMPIGHNLIIGGLTHALIRWLFGFLFLLLGQSVRPKWGIVQAGLCLFILLLIGFDFILFGCVVLGLVLFEAQHRWWPVFVAALCTAIGLFVKSSIGVICLSSLGMYGIYSLIKGKNILKAAIAGTISILTLLVVGLLVYGNVAGLSNFLWGTFQLIRQDLDGFALYPDNNWWLLGAGLLSLVVLRFVLQSELSKFTYWIFILPAFAAWKHAMSREDISHAPSFVFFLVLLFVILAILEKKPQLPVLVMTIVFGLLFNNLWNIPGFEGRKIRVPGFTNITNLVFYHDELKSKNIQQSKENITSSLLSPELRKRIGDKTVDTYPWEFSFIKANQLNWVPRPTLQYMPFNNWLDQQNANHYASENAPHFILWHLINEQRYGQFSSIDKKYILNDEPATTQSILNNYSLIHKEKGLLLFERNNDKYFDLPKLLTQETGDWNKWITVPKTENGILRATLSLEASILRKLKTKLYKGETFYLDYQFENGHSARYRVNPFCLETGIWINPLIQQPSTNDIEPIVSKLRFSTSNDRLFDEEFSIQWQLTPLKADTNSVYKLYGKTVPMPSPKQEYFLESNNTLENEAKYWSSDRSRLTNDAFEGEKAWQLNGGGDYSTTFIYNGFLDTLNLLETLHIETSLHAKKEAPTTAALVVSVVENNKNIYYATSNVNALLTQNNTWEYLYRIDKFPARVLKNKTAHLKIYVWNQGDKKLFVDDLQVKLWSE